MADISKRDAEVLNAKRFNYAVYRVLLRMLKSGGKFAVFARDQVVHFSNPEADNYHVVMKEEWPSFVGVFSADSDLEQIVAALKPHFTEERGLIESHLYA
jgi:hypothetical protein